MFLSGFAIFCSQKGKWAHALAGFRTYRCGEEGGGGGGGYSPSKVRTDPTH